ncbi:unnamed protein product [Caenorhabditis sp. 36 PRJEB53466]|nr:unnamed protein product [Caenorhabditis sp. 36 PRJEB53466]
MGFVDLNDYVWCWKARTHFYVNSIVHLAMSLFALLAIIDYVRLPEDASSELKLAFWIQFMWFIMASVFTAAICLSFVFCPNHIWYGILSIFLGLLGTYGLINETYVLAKYGILRTDDRKKVQLLEHYKGSMAGTSLQMFLSAASSFYLSAVLFKLSFLYTLKPDAGDIYIIQTGPPPPPAVISLDTNGNAPINRPPAQDPLPLEGPAPELEAQCAQRSDPVLDVTQAQNSQKSLEKSKKSEKSAKSHVENTQISSGSERK